MHNHEFQAINDYIVVITTEFFLCIYLFIILLFIC